MSDENFSGWIYLSFADQKKFLGACIVKANSTIEAIRLSHILRINPGGEVLGILVPKDKLPPDKYLGKFLTREDVYRLWPDAQTLREYDIENKSHNV